MTSIFFDPTEEEAAATTARLLPAPTAPNFPAATAWIYELPDSEILAAARAYAKAGGGPIPDISTIHPDDPDIAATKPAPGQDPTFTTQEGYFQDAKGVRTPRMVTRMKSPAQLWVEQHPGQPLPITSRDNVDPASEIINPAIDGGIDNQALMTTYERADLARVGAEEGVYYRPMLPPVSSGAEFYDPYAPTAGPSAPTGFVKNFAASFNEQVHVNAAYGLDVDLYNLEQQNLDKIYQLTGQRLSPVLQSFYTSIGTRGQTDAVLHSLAGDQLSASQQSYMASAQKQMDQVNDLAQKYPGVMSYPQMFSQLKQQAQQYVDATDDANARATFMGKVGGFAGSFVGGLMPTDAENYPLLGLGGVGKSILAQAVSQAGMGAVATAANHLIGADEDARMLGYEKTPGQVAEDIALGGAIPGAAHVAGAAVGAGFRAVVQHFGGKAADMTAAALVHEGESVLGPGPYGTSRAAEGLHSAQVLDALARDTPMNVPGLEHADPAVVEGAFATRDTDALFTGTNQPLQRILTGLPDSSADVINGNRVINGYTDRLAVIEKSLAGLEARAEAARAHVMSDAEVQRLQARAADLGNAIAQADESAARGLSRDKASVDAALNHAEAVNSDLAAIGAEQNRMAAVGDQLRIARSQAVAQVLRNGGAGTVRREVAAAFGTGTPAQLLAAPSSAPSEGVERGLSTAKAADRPAPKARIIPAERPAPVAPVEGEAARPVSPIGEAGDGAKVELGQRSGPVDLDTQVVTGFDEANQPIVATIRDVLKANQEDDDLIRSMNNCLLER